MSLSPLSCMHVVPRLASAGGLPRVRVPLALALAALALERGQASPEAAQERAEKPEGGLRLTVSDWSASGAAARITALALCALALCAVSANPAWSKALTAKQTANKVLRLDPRKPADIDLFTSKYANGADGFYPQGSAMHAASGPDPTEARARAKLKSYLVEQFPNDTAKVHSALALFDGQQAKDMIPDPTLRAAFVGMREDSAPTVDQPFAQQRQVRFSRALWLDPPARPDRNHRRIRAAVDHLQQPL